MIKKYRINSIERHRYEAEFYDKWIQKRREPTALIITQEMIQRVEHNLNSLGIDTNLKGKRVLDCGCGSGFLSVSLAMKGCLVSGIDLSSECIKVTTERSKLHGVEHLIESRVMSMEELDYHDDYFDMVIGMFVLHHVNVEKGGQEILRVLKPGCKAIFMENNANNKILMLARRLLPGHFGISKLSNGIEHPLTAFELDLLRKIFGGYSSSHYIDFTFFKMLDQYVFRKRVKPFSFFLEGLDSFVFKFLPFLRKYSYYQVVVLKKDNLSLD